MTVSTFEYRELIVMFKKSVKGDVSFVFLLEADIRR